MARAVSAARFAALTDPRRRSFARVLVEDPDSNYVDVSALFGLDFFKACSLIVDGLDQPAPSGTITLVREHRASDGTVYSLAPTVAGSPINRNGLGNYARFLKAGRGVKVFLGWDVPDGVDDFPDDYLEVFRGKIDDVDWKGRDGEVLLEVRGLAARLLDKFIEDERDYSDDTGVAIEDVMQQILDDNAEDGFDPIILYVPESPGVNLRAFRQARKSVLEALRDLAFQIGWTVAYRWFDDGTYRLTLYEPDRAKAAADWWLGPRHYFDVAQLKESDADVRNKIRGKAVAADGSPITVDRSDDASIGEYRTRFMEFQEDSTSAIDTEDELTAMVEAALADLANPLADQEIENDLFPIAEVGDMGGWQANGVHYDADQTLAVVQVRHEITKDSRRTFIQCRGTVSGGAQEWLRRGKSSSEGTDESTFDPSTIYLGNFREIERTAETVKYGFKPSPDVAQIWIYAKVRAPSGVEPWPPDADAVALGADPESPTEKLDADTTEYTVDIPADGKVAYVQLEARDAELRAGDLQRVRVFAPSAKPVVNKLKQSAGPTGLYTAVSFEVVDPRGLGGTVNAWVNPDSVDNADPDADPDGTLSVADTPATVDGTSVFSTDAGPATLLHAINVHPGKGKRVYFEFVNAAGDSSGQLSITLLTNSSIIDENGDLVDGAIKTAAQFATTVQPVQVLSALPSSAADGTVVLLTTDGQLYRRNGGAWTLAVPAVNITGAVVASQIADAAVTTAKFASGIRPVRILSSLPGAGDVTGDVVFLTTDKKLYRWDGSAWTTAVATVDLTGTIDTAQIANAAITAAKIGAAAVTTAALANAAVTTAILAAGAVTTTEISDNAISTPKLIAGSITTAKIATGAVTTNEIAANTITAGDIAAGTITTAEIAAATITGSNIAALTIVAGNIAAATITGAKIAANTITASNIAADTITAGEIAAGAISTSELAANAVTAAKIAAGTITATEIAALTITGGNIAAGAITASKITAGTITSTELSANSIVAGKIASGAVNASAIIVDGVITAAKISVSVLSGISSDIGTIVAGVLNSVNGHSYINLNATGTNPFIYHETAGGAMRFKLLANGDATFAGEVSSSSFTTGHAYFSGEADFVDTVVIDGGGAVAVQFKAGGVETALVGYGVDGLGDFGVVSRGNLHLVAAAGHDVYFELGSGGGGFTTVGRIADVPAFSGFTNLYILRNSSGSTDLKQVELGPASGGYFPLRVPT